MKREMLTNESVQQANDFVQEVKQAQNILKTYSQYQIDTIVQNMADAALRESIRLAALAVEETGFGNISDKVVKNEFASKHLHLHIKEMKTIGVLNTNPETMTMDVAVPLGVLAGLVPSTNPTSTAIYKAIIAIKSGNGIVIAPHPSAFNCINEAIKVVYDAAIAAGAPHGIIRCLNKLSLEGTQALMTNQDTALILATGGEAMVRAAYSSGNPAIGVGPGNCPVYIEKSACVQKAVDKILTSKTFDNGVICASEQAIVIEKSMELRICSELNKRGAYFLSEQESEQLSQFMLRENGTMNPQIVGKKAGRVAELAGLSVPEGVTLLISPQNAVSKTNPYSREKLAPVLALYVEENNEAAINRCLELLENEGKGHTASIHSNNQNIIRDYSMRMPVSRCLVNTPSAMGGIGATTDLTPSLTLGCGAVGGSSLSDNVGPQHLYNVKKVAYHFDMKIKDVA